MGNGNRTRNRRSHSPVLCQLSYSHREKFIIARDSRVGVRLANANPSWDYTGACENKSFNCREREELPQRSRRKSEVSDPVLLIRDLS